MDGQLYTGTVSDAFSTTAAFDNALGSCSGMARIYAISPMQASQPANPPVVDGDLHV